MVEDKFNTYSNWGWSSSPQSKTRMAVYIFCQWKHLS